jgi:isopenicillin N synthase-like dioxygenase
MERFYESCQTLHLQLLTAIALSFSLPPTFFSARCSRNSSELRLNHYPPAKTTDLQDGRMMRISSHTDFGTVTLLFQDGVGGLEVEDQDRSGVYIPVLPTKGSSEWEGDGGTSHGRGGSGIGRELIVNVGDCLQRWTNDRLRSANHRVTLPVGMKGCGSGAGSSAAAADGSGSSSSSSNGTLPTHEVPRRYSVAYFGKPDREALVGAIPELVRDGEHVKYGGTMTAWEYNQSRLLQTY